MSKPKWPFAPSKFADLTEPLPHEPWMGKSEPRTVERNKVRKPWPEPGKMGFTLDRRDPYAHGDRHAALDRSLVEDED